MTVAVERRRTASVDPPAFSVVVPLAADEPPPDDLIARLPADMEVILARGGALLFFDLSFDGPALMALNGAGARLRSRLLRLPFGDQALCIEAALFRRLGGYPAVPRGEDHLLVWRAHRAGVPVRPVGARITTSSRRYSTRGWARTTALHLALTVRQAAPELLAFLRRR